MATIRRGQVQNQTLAIKCRKRNHLVKLPKYRLLNYLGWRSYALLKTVSPYFLKANIVLLNVILAVIQIFANFEVLKS